MIHSLSDRVIALAGLFQAIRLVQQIARTGMTDQNWLETSIRSIFILDADTPEEIYSGTANLRLGLETLIFQLGGGDQSQQKEFDAELTKYFINIVILERKMSARKKMLDDITDSIESTQSQVKMFSYTHDNVLARLADVYSSTISHLNPRIMVNGEHHHLSNSNNANKIRALLLAAIRSAVLWRQCGGKRWQLLFHRARLIREAEQMLKSARIH